VTLGSATSLALDPRELGEVETAKRLDEDTMADVAGYPAKHTQPPGNQRQASLKDSAS
jgi:hypothetical protein